MTTKNDGGPAFPSALYSHERAENWSTDGMTLRDWFAGHALAGDLAASPNYRPSLIGSAERAYAYADAMLAARAV